MEINIPDKFLPFFGSYGVVEVDPSAQQPVGWGYPIVGGQMGHELWAEMTTLGTVAFDHKLKTYALVTKKLTDEEAIQKYGPISAVEHGPRGGFKSITFGSTKFSSKLFKR